MRMRTQAMAYREIVETDPNTALTPHALRKMILAGRIPSVRVGAKYLIDMDNLEQALAQTGEDKPLRRIR